MGLGQGCEHPEGGTLSPRKQGRLSRGDFQAGFSGFRKEF